MMLRKFYSNIQASRKPTILSLINISYSHRPSSFIIKEYLSVSLWGGLQTETLATTVNLDTDIDLWSNDMSNIKHANIGTR